MRTISRSSTPPANVSGSEHINPRRIYPAPSSFCVKCFRILPKPDAPTAGRCCERSSSIVAAIPSLGGWPHDPVQTHRFDGCDSHKAPLRRKHGKTVTFYPSSSTFKRFFLTHGSILCETGKHTIAPERACFGRLGFFRKIHRLDSRLTHRPTNRMILTSLVLDHN
jgi:hypothetical protein